MTDRIERSEMVLQRFRPGRYSLLGCGFAGVVFTDGEWVYKVHEPISQEGYGEQDHLPFLASKLDAFRDAVHLYPLRELACQDGVYILVYPYEESDPVDTASEEEWCSYLAETWERRILCRSVKLSTNFRRAKGVLKLIDYEIEPYDDNLFLNAAARAFTQLPRVSQRAKNVEKLRRSVLNQFNLPELDGFSDFLARVAQTIAARARSTVWSQRGRPSRSTERLESMQDLEDLLIASTERLYVSMPMDAVDPHRAAFVALRCGFRLIEITAEAPEIREDIEASLRVEAGFAPLVDPPCPVTLLIKACSQDTAHLEYAVSHLVRSLSGPERFAERVLALDLSPRERFVRQFTTASPADALLAAASRLVDAGIIDRVVSGPSEAEEVRAVNRRWFGLDTPHTHTAQGVPVAPQLAAFDTLHTDAVLQVDVDVLVGVRDPDRRVLADMLTAFDNPRVLSVAYPICRPVEEVFQPYFGFDNGGFVPEVRCCLLLRSRIESMRPLPNRADVKGLALGWYRAVEARQRETSTCSLRGGPGARFFIHPQNYRKGYPSTWLTLIDRVEQGAIPAAQIGQPELRGALAQWQLPAREEDIVVVVVVTDEAPSRIAHQLMDLAAQTCSSFGVVLVDASGRRLGGWIARAVGFDRHRLTVVDRHERVVKPTAVLEAVRAFVRSDDALVCMIDAGDVIIGRRAIEQIRNRARLYRADVIIGKELSKARLSLMGKAHVDLLAPRRDPRCLGDGIRVARRYLLDALDLRDLQVQRSIQEEPNTFQRLSRSHSWIDDPSLLCIMVPAVELAQNPVTVDSFHLWRQRESDNLDPSLDNLLRSRTPKLEGDYQRGRKRFAPNLRRIEIDITYDCNLKCVACNRSCTQAPSQAAMSLAHIRSFIDESITQARRWEVINILGGEPTLHPDFDEIIAILLRDYVDAYSPATMLQITSNGLGPKVRQRLDALPVHPRLFVNQDSFKDGPKVPYFTPFNDAPIDDPAFVNSDFTRGCWVTSYCGVGLNHLGYFPCAVAGGIERVLGERGGASSLVTLEPLLESMLDTYCRLCGNFKHYDSSRGDFIPRSEKDVCDTPVVSQTWQDLYARRR